MQSKISRSFSRHAEHYERHAGLQRIMAEKLAAYLPQPLPQRITEVGCGTGLFTRHLLDRNPKRLVLNDIAPGMIAYLQSRLALPQETRILPGNAEKIDFPAADLIAGNAVFQWFEDEQTTLRRFHAALAPGGRILFSTFGPDTLKEFRETAAMQSPTDLRSLKAWESALRTAGFEVEASRRELKRTHYPDTLALIRTLQQMGAAPLRMLSAGDLRRKMRAFDQRYAIDGGVPATWELLYLSAAR